MIKQKDTPGGPLRYLGTGWFPNVPARDLSAEEVDELERAKVITRAALIASGHYAEGGRQMTAPAPAQEA